MEQRKEKQKKHNVSSGVYASLTFRESTKQDVAYIKDLALREIGIVPRRLHKHKTFMIYQEQKPVGFLSYCRVGGSYLYIYLMAFEKEAQNQGYALKAGRWMFLQENAVEPVNGIFARIHKTNQQALHATMTKYGYKITKESPRYYLLFSPVDQKKD